MPFVCWMPLSLSTFLKIFVTGLHRAEVWLKLLMSRPTVTRNLCSKFARPRHGKLETIWVRSYHLKRSYRPEARWLLCFGGKHLFATSSRHSLPYKLFLLAELAPHTIWTTSNLLMVLSCSTTKNRVELCSRTPCVIRITTDFRLLVCRNFYFNNHNPLTFCLPPRIGIHRGSRNWTFVLECRGEPELLALLHSRRQSERHGHDWRSRPARDRRRMSNG